MVSAKIFRMQHREHHWSFRGTLIAQSLNQHDRDYQKGLRHSNMISIDGQRGMAPAGGLNSICTKPSLNCSVLGMLAILPNSTTVVVNLKIVVYSQTVSRSMTATINHDSEILTGDWSLSSP